ncbi:MAG: methyltransferase domain-containing protein, partial [Planctomycetota bacterium]|nr:methyltransferase domain-containing protein [Planctomycetota bacterium]
MADDYDLAAARPAVAKAGCKPYRRLEYLRQRFAALSIRPRRAWGQNFLLDTNLARYIARLGAPGPGDVILEVGCGSGLLTRHLAASGSRVIAVEIDARLLSLAREDLSGAANVQFIAADILAGKHRVNPVVCDEIKSALATVGEGGRLKTVSNLPYAVGTPFVANLFSSELPWERGVFLLQQEVAERLIARPGEGRYGPLAIYAALAGQARIARLVPPAVFWP